MKTTYLLAAFALTITSCSSMRQTPSSVKAVTLNNYAVNENIVVEDSISYQYFFNEVDFYKMFTMTKATRETAIVPSFTGQCVVAIVLQPTDKIISLEINKAEIMGKDLNVYYTLTDTTNRKAYIHTPSATATVPKYSDLRQVNFYRNGMKDKTIPTSN